MDISSLGQTNSSQTATSQATLNANLDTFLTLLTTQLQNQNPLEPLKAEQFTEQLTQFTGLEQQIQTNEKLDSLISASATQFASSVINYVGRTVTANGSVATLDEGRAQWAFNSAAPTNNGLATVRNGQGDVIYEERLDIKRGEQTFTWNGKTNDGGFAPEGNYILSVSGQDSSGSAIRVTTDISGQVSKVDVTQTPPQLTVGTTQVPLSAITSVATGG